MRNIGAFELIDHGIEWPDYFQGCGVAFPSYENAVTGIGVNPAEAIEDCLEQMAQVGLRYQRNHPTRGTFDTEGMEARIMAQEGWEALPITPNAMDDYEGGGEEYPYYHVSIRWNEGSTEP